MTINTVYFCTSNAGKFAEVKRILEPEFTVIKIKLDLDELQSTDTEYVCRHKLAQAIEQLKSGELLGGHSISTNYALLVEDTGLEIDNMNGFPGALVKFYLDYLKPEGISKFNAGSKASMLVTMVAYLSNTRTTWTYTYKVPGIITNRPMGIQGFGFDSIFECIQHPDNLTLAQMMPDVKQEYSARSECAKALKNHLLLILNNLDKNSLEFDTVCTGLQTPKGKLTAADITHNSKPIVPHDESSDYELCVTPVQTVSVFEYEGKNRCIICSVDIGECNPRQYCRKTYCENALDFMNVPID